MNRITRLARAIRSLFPTVVGYPGNAANLLASFDINGGIPNIGAWGVLQQVIQSLSPVGGAVNSINSAAATLTLTAIAGAVVMLTNGGAVTVTMDNAYNIVNTIPLPALGQKFPLTIAGTTGTTVAAPTVTNTGVTLSGTTTVTTGGQRFYSALITQLFSSTASPLTAGTTFTSLTQVGTSNLYTLALGTNAITTVVGNLIYVGVTTGTLPAGWYPVYSAGTTSIVIATPPNSVAWTATAATMVAPGAAPSTYAPLITLTGLYGMAAGVIVV